MSTAPDHLKTLDDMITDAVAMGVGHHTAQDQHLAGRTIRIDGRDLINFASCSYLGLELDPRIISGVVDAATRYGSQFSSSRVFVSAPAYGELEEQLSALFGADTLVAPSTTLGHLATLPVLIGPEDAALLDHHVHNSVQMASNQLAIAGTKVEIVRHHDLEHLEERIEALSAKRRKIWFLVDGVCSMFGDLAPMQDFLALLDRHDNLQLYVDDAHGMSWSGRNGRGYALGNASLHPKMVLATSLNKAFGAAGSAVVFPNAEMRRRVRTCGATLLFSGPIQPPMLGAALASAKIHLSPEFTALQARFARHADTCRKILAETQLYTCSDPRSPVQFVEVGLPHKAQQLAKWLMDDGYFANVAQFPAVPMRRAGIRFTLTLHQQEDDLRGLVDSLQRNYEVLSEDSPVGRRTLHRIGGREGLGAARPAIIRDLNRADEDSGYRIERTQSIDQIPADEWNRLLGARGCFAAEALGLLERTFRNHDDVLNRWGFHYYRVLDQHGTTQLATFFTDAIWKADMLAPATVSRAVEEVRAHDPLHLTHRVFSMGCLLSEGNHLYLDPALDPPGSPQSRSALSLLLAAVQEDAAECCCNTIALRDLEDPDGVLEAFLRHKGFVSMPLPDSMELEISWSNDQEFFSRLSRKSRRHQRVAVRPFDDAYRVEVFSCREHKPSQAELGHFYELYRNVKSNNLELNTFDLPPSLFDQCVRDENWEIVALYPNEQVASALPVGMVVCFIGDGHYVPLIVGLDYRYVESRGLYRQCMRRLIERAQKLGLSRLCFGMGADLEKHRFGASARRRFLFLQTDDHYIFDSISQMTVDQTEFND